ncbi:plasmid stabilization protein [Chlorobaculum limnaeum]|uniref:Plasmid stabilization protein n=1 Tax=Chlorobaculum limnaeum TaxID=274537 RepID=A0A1D8D4M3_CHLLM|nr:type II toxin-antitoxin system RelE/ParE family toxin [Chlorobaculum limnaeum]AOS84197.1 plasmid stabilization protein [Chlorobaculum limnaeum]
MSYRIEILRSARKQLEKIQESDRNRIIDSIRSLAEKPRPTGSKKLSGRQAWRIRIGSYRVIYEIQDSELIILVVTVGHRREVYR